MPSWQARLVHWIISAKFYWSRRQTHEQSINNIIANYPTWTAATVLPPSVVNAPGVNTTREDIDGWEVFHMTPAVNEGNEAIVYWHGGALIRPMFPQHWVFVLRLIKELNIPIIIPMYTLAPIATSDEFDKTALAFTLQISQDERYKDKELIHMGDSAGGYCLLKLLELLCSKALEGDEAVKRALGRMGRAVMYSPLVTLELDEATLKAAEDDWWLNPTTLGIIGTIWPEGPQAIPQMYDQLSPELKAKFASPPHQAGTISLTDPNHSPIYGLDVFERYAKADPTQGPFRFLTFTGTADLTWGGTAAMQRMTDRMDPQAIQAEYVVEPGLYHVYQFTPVPEAEKAWKRMLRFLQ